MDGRRGRKGIRPPSLALVLTTVLLACGGSVDLQPEIQDNATLFLDDSGLGGRFVASGQSALAEKEAFKEHLAVLLRANDGSLARLVPHDVVAQQIEPDGWFWAALTKRHVLASSIEVSFVPDQVRIDFSINFDHSRGLSQKALREALRRIADGGVGASIGRTWHQRNETRRTSIPKVCSKEKQEAYCKKTCSKYMVKLCGHCECGPHDTGTPSCTCVLDQAIFFSLVFSNSAYACLMLLVGLCGRSMILKTPQLDKKKWPNIGGEQFYVGVFGCTQNMNVTCMACCCPAVRLAMTYYYGNVSSGYAKTLFVFCLLWGIPGYSAYFLIPIVLLHGRKRMSLKGNIESPGICTEVCCVSFCGICTMIQEGQHVDECTRHVAKKKLEDSGDLVGQAVALQETAI